MRFIKNFLSKTKRHNTGDYNAGRFNIGNHNTGDYNAGYYNTGHCNTGFYNTGDRNTGDRNTGNWNTGDRNTGDRNTGDCNTGDCNTGDWNLSDFNTGCFNTEEVKNLLFFNKPSNWSYKDWLNSMARKLLNQIPKNVVEWVCSKNMTDEEKISHPEYETTGGYLKVLDELESAQIWWDELTADEKNCIKSIPNFDKSIFEKVTGIKTDLKEVK